jgi:hypothetical protein
MVMAVMHGEPEFRMTSVRSNEPSYSQPPYCSPSGDV